MKMKFSSQGFSLVHQRGRRFFVLEHQYGRCDFMWKHPLLFSKMQTSGKEFWT